jgi:hypothetical protein
VDIVTGFGWDAIWIGSFVFGNASFYHREMTNISTADHVTNRRALAGLYRDREASDPERPTSSLKAGTLRPREPHLLGGI